MPRRSISRPSENVGALAALLHRAEGLGVDPAAFADTRAAIDRAERLDPEAADLVTNPSGQRQRLAVGLTDGSITLDQARRQITEATQRQAADAELHKVLKSAHSTAERAAWDTAAAVGWYDELGPIGTDAAGLVVQLADKLPDGFDDAAALRASADLRKLWLSFDAAARTWRGATSLLAELRWSGLADPAPFDSASLSAVPDHEWQYDGETTLRMTGEVSRERPQGAAPDQRDRLAQLLEGVQSGRIVPAAPSPSDVHGRLRARRALFEANRRLVSLGYTAIPGATAPRDYVLPPQARSLLVSV